MERLINKDFAFQGFTTHDTVYQNFKDSILPNIAENNTASFDFNRWESKIYEFNQAFEVKDINRLILILGELLHQLESKDDLIASFIDPIEKSNFYNCSINCFGLNNDDLIGALMKCYSYMTFVSSDFIKSFCQNGVLNHIITNFTFRMDSNIPYPPNIIQIFFELIGNVGMDDPMWQFQVSQLGIIHLCNKILLSNYNIVVIESVIKCLENMFEYSEEHKSLPYSQVSSIFNTLKILIASILMFRSNSQTAINQEIPQNPNDINKYIFNNVISGNAGIKFDSSVPIERLIRLAINCFTVFENYGNSNATISILLNSTVPQFCYEFLNPNFPMIFKNENQRNYIVNSASKVIKMTFRFGPHELLQDFIIKQIDINLLTLYVNPNLPETATCILSAIGHIMSIYKNTVFAAIEAGLFEKIYQLYNDADFELKTTISHVIAAAIINGTTSVVSTLFYKSDIIDILTDAIDTNMLDCKNDIPAALNILSQCSTSKNEGVYSMDVPFINEMPDIQLIE